MDLICKKDIIKNKLLSKNYWVVFIFVILIAGTSYSSYQYSIDSKGYMPFFCDIILDQTNGLIDICFIIPFAWILVTGNPVSKIYEVNLKTFTVIRNIFIINMICIFSFIVINFIIYVLISGLKNPFINFWITNNQMYKMGFLPMEACLISLLLLYIRMTFFTVISLAINTVAKSEIYGFLGITIICLLDWGLYEWLKIYEPMGLLPVEHSRIVYTEGYAPMTSTDIRISFGSTILYWIVLYLMGLLLFGCSRRKGNEEING